MRLAQRSQAWRLLRTHHLIRSPRSFCLRATGSVRSQHTTARPTVASLLGRSSLQGHPNGIGVLEGSTICVNGFVRTVRRQKKLAFAAIGDGSTLESLQVVLSPGQAEGLSTGVAVSIVGKWQLSPLGKEQSHELHAEEIRILGGHEAASYPLQKKFHSPEFLRTIPHLRSRLPFNSLLLRLRSQLIASATSFFSEIGYVQTHPPLITSSDCEGAGEVFTVSTSTTKRVGPAGKEDHFFRDQKYLTVSSQLHLEALAQAVGKVWTLSPTFRAEKSDTSRHLSEFYMLEAEVAFVDNAHEIMDVVENMVRDMTIKLTTSRVGSELLMARSAKFGDSQGQGITTEELQQRWNSIIRGPWPRVTYIDAIEALQKAVCQDGVQFEYSPSSADGLQAEHERYLAETIGDNGPVFITDYPTDLKPFYMAPSSAQGQLNHDSTVGCFDLLVPELCEIAGGSMREHRLPMLIESMKRHNLAIPADYESVDPEGVIADSESIESQHPLRWYLDLRKYGSVPHGGFGLGFDRLLCYLSGTSSVRDTVGFPRWHGRCDC